MGPAYTAHQYTVRPIRFGRRAHIVPYFVLATTVSIHINSTILIVGLMAVYQVGTTNRGTAVQKCKSDSIQSNLSPQRQCSAKRVDDCYRIRYFFWAGSVGISLAPHKFPPEHRLLLLLAGPFQLFFAPSTFFVLLPFSHFFRFFDSSFLLFRLCLYLKPANNELGLFPSIRLTLSPVTGRRPDYTIFSVDIAVTDVTKNSRLFAVTSTHVLRF